MMTQKQRERLSVFLSQMPGGTVRAEEGVLLSAMTSFRLGGAADLVLTPTDTERFCSLLRFLREEDIRFYVLGNGTNVLFADGGFRGVILSAKGLNRITPLPFGLRAQAGVSVTYLASCACERSLSGLEFLYGIPGSVGGAVYMNAGAYGGEVKQVLSSALCCDGVTGQVRRLSREELCLDYRHSLCMEQGLTVLEADFVCQAADKAKIREKMDDLMGRRAAKQPLEYPSAGSTFKRYPGRFTGQMIEAAGLKGLTVGGAQVSQKHAGFLINRGGATSADMLALIAEVKKRIRETEGVELECEVEIIPEDR